MDPLSVVSGSLAVAGRAFTVGTAIYKFAHSARHVDKTIEALADEIKALGKICESIGEIGDIEKSLGTDTEPQLLQCKVVLDKLEKALPRVSSRFPRLSNPIAQTQLNMRQDEIDECRKQISNSTSNLQLCLQLSIFKAAFLAPQLANESLKKEREEIKRTLQAHGQKLDDNLVFHASRYYSEGQSLYAQSNAASSITGTPSSLQHKAISGWVRALNTLRLDADAEASSEATFSDVVLSNQEPTTSTSNATHDSQCREETIAQSDGEDFEYHLANDLTEAAFAEGGQSFRSGDFGNAENMLREGLKHLQSLPERLRHGYALDELHFQLAVCAFHLHDLENAEAALLSVVQRESISDTDAIQKLEAALLLAQVYVKLNKLDLAKSTTENVYQGRRKLLQKDSEACFEAIGMLYRISELLDASSSAAVYSKLLPAERREEYCHKYHDLQMISQPATEQHCSSAKNPNVGPPAASAQHHRARLPTSQPAVTWVFDYSPPWHQARFLTSRSAMSRIPDYSPPWL